MLMTASVDVLSDIIKVTMQQYKHYNEEDVMLAAVT